MFSAEKKNSTYHDSNLHNMLHYSKQSLIWGQPYSAINQISGTQVAFQKLNLDHSAHKNKLKNNNTEYLFKNYKK
jgi:hypothetical protein